MKLNLIKEKAIGERSKYISEALSKYDELADVFDVLNNFFSIIVPEELIEDVESHLDSINVPCFIYQKVTLIIAKTYSQLLKLHR